MGSGGTLHDIPSLTFADLVIENRQTIIILSVLYFVSLIYCIFRTYRTFGFGTRVKKELLWDIPKVYVSLVLFCFIIRIITFCVLLILICSKKLPTSSTDADNVFKNLVTILFNFGDWVALSIYLMLLVIWIETLQLTRHHFFSSNRIRRTWITVFVTANILLYLLQITLYSVALIAPGKFTDPSTLSRIVFIVTASVSAFLPLALLVTWAVYFCLLAGFPYKSLIGKAMLKHIMQKVVIWTVCREVWAMFIFAYFHGDFLSRIENSLSWWLTAILVTLFLVTELFPALFTIDNTTIQYMQPLNESRLISEMGVNTMNIGILPDDFIKTTSLSMDDDFSYPPSFINNCPREPLLTLRPEP